MEILTEKELAAKLGLSPWTVRKWRLEYGLPHIPMHRRIFYRLHAVEEWLRDRERTSNIPKDCASFISVA